MAEEDYLYQAFAVTGSASVSVLDSTGLVSTKEEPKTLVSIIPNVSDYKDNILVGWVEREKRVEIYDKVLGTEADNGDTNTPYSTGKMLEIPVNFEIPVGQDFKVGMDCGANATNLHGAYKYLIRKP